MTASNLLLIDTAMPQGLVALARGGEIMAHVYLQESRSHGEKLAHAIDTVMSTASLTPKDLHGIVVGIGPGSFVGVRVGLSTAKGFALALKIPLWGVSTLASLAGGVCDKASSRVMALIDARRGQGYVQSFVQNESGLTEDGTGKALDPHDLDQMAAAHDVVVGNGSFLLAQPPASCHELFGVTGNGMLAAFQARCAKEVPENEMLHLVPMYIRPPDAKKPAVRPDYSVNPSTNK